MPTITFTPIDKYAEEVAEKPRLATQTIPQWYKDLPLEVPGKKFTGAGTNSTMKRCIPVFDYMASGYIIPLWADINVNQTYCDDESCTEHDITVSWRISRTVISIHNADQITGIQIPSGYYQKTAFKLDNQFLIRTPKGYSSLFLPVPEESPMWAIPGIVDTDKYNVAINFPFFFKENMEGVITKGTPVVRVIPFKRENWSVDMTSAMSTDKHDFSLERLKTVIYDNYKHNLWVKKRWH